jgi:hypothetical protein
MNVCRLFRCCFRYTSDEQSRFTLYTYIHIRKKWDEKNTRTQESRLCTVRVRHARQKPHKWTVTITLILIYLTAGTVSSTPVVELFVTEEVRAPGAHGTQDGIEVIVMMATEIDCKPVCLSRQHGSLVVRTWGVLKSICLENCSLGSHRSSARIPQYHNRVCGKREKCKFTLNAPCMCTRQWFHVSYYFLFHCYYIYIE